MPTSVKLTIFTPALGSSRRSTEQSSFRPLEDSKSYNVSLYNSRNATRTFKKIYLVRIRMKNYRLRGNELQNRDYLEGIMLALITLNS